MGQNGVALSCPHPRTLRMYYAEFSVKGLAVEGSSAKAELGKVSGISCPHPMTLRMYYA